MSGILALLAAGGGFTLTIAPSSQTSAGTTTTYTFAAEVVTVVGGSSPSYVWSVSGGVIGTWSILSGQGTASCVFRVQNMSPGFDDSATASCTVTSAGVSKTISAQLNYTNIS